MSGNRLWSGLGRNGLTTLFRRRRPAARQTEGLSRSRLSRIQALIALQLGTDGRPKATVPGLPDRAAMPRPLRSNHAVGSLGWVPGLAVSAAVGIAICAGGDALSRSMFSASQRPFWIGLLVIIVPIAYRVSSTVPARTERLLLVLLFGIALYLVKVIQSPFGFTYADELVHEYNTEQILHGHSLFAANPILPVTSRYPGLETVAAAVGSMTGLGSFASGLIAVGVARVLMILALYLLFERVAGSARIASLGTLVYAANANFLFFSAQFAYESLALPLLVFVLAMVAERQAAKGQARHALALPIVLGVGAVAVTHHLTSYALVAALVLLVGASRLRGVEAFRRSPWPFALFALVFSAAWLIVVAGITLGYVTPVLTSAITASLHTLSGETAPRRLFASSTTGGYQAPLIERAVGLGAVLALALATPLGLRRLFRRRVFDPFVLLFAFGAVGFFGVLFLRFAPAAWETANRASEFLYIGLAFVVAEVPLGRLLRKYALWVSAAVSTAWLTLVFCGGVITGWEPPLRLSQPYRLAADGGTIDPEGVLLARWARAQIGPGAGFAATEADARLLLANARERAVTGVHPDVHDVLAATRLAPWQLSLLRENGLRYVATDLRQRSTDPMSGYYFALESGGRRREELADQSTATKFDAARADRLYDSGSIKVYDMGRRTGAAPKR